MSLRGVYGDIEEQTMVQGSREAISWLQSTVTQDGLMVARNADKSVPNALTTTLENMVQLGKLPPLDQLWTDMDDALLPETLTQAGLSFDEVHHINEPLHRDAGEPTFAGKISGHNHASSAFRICKSLSKKNQARGFSYQLLITTERLGLPVQVQLFSASPRATRTVCLHRAFRSDGSESWKPYRLCSPKLCNGVSQLAEEDVDPLDGILATNAPDAFGMPAQGPAEMHSL